MLQTIQNKYCDCLYYHSLCNILYVLQPFYTMNVNFRLLQPDTYFIGVSNTRVCLGQLQVNANTISEEGDRGQGWHMKSSAWLPLNMKQCCPNLEILTEYFHAFFHSTWTQTISACIWKCGIGLFCRHLKVHITSIFRVEGKCCSHIKGRRKVVPPSSG